MGKITRKENRAVVLATIGFLILSVGALVIASKHNLHLAVAIGAIGTIAMLAGSIFFLENEYRAALGFWDLGALLLAAAAVLVGLHHQWIWETALGGIGLLLIFAALVSIEVCHKDSCKEEGESNL